MCTTLPFGWKNSPYVYQTIGLVATNFFRRERIACSLYIDDRLNGELFTKRGFRSGPIDQRDIEYRYKSAAVALYIACIVLTHLGYFLGLKKSARLSSCATDPLLWNANRLYLASIFDS